MKTRITIGELAKLYNIPAQTLRFYDKEGLFKPLYVDECNGYRYYGIEQFALLDVIIFLRELGLPIQEIKYYVSNRDLDSFIELLDQKKLSLIEEINRLLQRKESIEEKVELIKEYRNSEINGQVYLKECSARKLIKVNMENDMDKASFEYGLKELSSFIKDEAILFRAIITLTIDKSNVKSRVYNQWRELAFVFNDNVTFDIEHTYLAAGLYASITYYGPYNNGEVYFHKLIEWIEERGYEVMGDAAVLNIAEAAFSGQENEYITEIQIPVKKS